MFISKGLFQLVEIRCLVKTEDDEAERSQKAKKKQKRVIKIEPVTP